MESPDHPDQRSEDQPSTCGNMPSDHRRRHRRTLGRDLIPGSGRNADGAPGKNRTCCLLLRRQAVLIRSQTGGHGELGAHPGRQVLHRPSALIRLSTIAQMEGMYYKPRIDRAKAATEITDGRGVRVELKG